MGFMEQAAAKLARKYGTVSEGKHEGCQVAMGNDPSKKVEATYTFSQIIFLQDTEEMGRYNLVGDVKMIKLVDLEETGFQVKIFFADGEECKFLLETAAKQNEKENMFVSMIKAWFGMKKTNLTPEQERQENVKNIKIFMRSTMPLLDATSLTALEMFYKNYDVMEDVDAKLIALNKKRFEK